jgi:hypothetical protein
VLEKFRATIPSKDKCDHVQATRCFTLWCRVVRGLFGEEVLSYRYTTKFSRVYTKYIQGKSKGFAALLQAKFNFLDPAFCESIQDSFLALVDEDKYVRSQIEKTRPGSTIANEDPDCHIAFVCEAPKKPTDVLVFAAASDFDLKAMSYPEFCASPAVMQQSSQMHPALKLARFVHYLFAHYNKLGRGTPLTVKPETMEVILSSLSKFPITELPGQFPCIKMSSIALEESSRLTSCHQMCTNENPRNLRALTSDATRGFKPKQEVVRAKWKLEPVTDVDGFAGLAKVWPEAVTMLGDDNLLTLVCQGPADLAKIVLSMIPATLPTTAHIRYAAGTLCHITQSLISWLPLRFYVAWRLYQLRRTNEDSVRSNGLTMALDGSSLFDVLGMFGWAAQHGQSMITVEKPADLQACTVADLVKATTSAIAVNQSQACDAVVCAAWRGLFAPLLRECLPHLPADVWYILAASGQPEAEWPEVLRLLAAVLQGHASPDNINTLGDILGPQSCTLLEHYCGKACMRTLIDVKTMSRS